MTSGSQQTETRRWLLPFLAALIVALSAILGLTTASASSGGVAETPVGALNVVAEVLVEPPQGASPGQRLREAPPHQETAVATGVAANAATKANRAGRAYPDVMDPRTGSPIDFPGDGLTKIPVGQRVPWGGKERGAFIKEWYDRWYSTPAGGWSGYDVHHIRPREYGGTNDFDNLVPIPRDVHQQQFNSWWRDY